MRKSMITGILVVGMLVSSTAFAQTKTDEVTELKQRVAQLEKKVDELTQLTEPLKAQLAMETRRKALREKFDKKMAQDRTKYTDIQLSEAESLYQVANQKWGTPEANDSLQAMIKKYPDINRTGCAVLYIAQKSEGAARAKYLQDCIEKYNDCMYGDGVQVGVLARFLLAADYQSKGEKEKAAALYSELKTKYAEAVDHGGNLLTDSIKAE